MTLFSPTVLYPPIATHNRLASSDTVFGISALIILTALAVLSAALNVVPIVDPEICIGC